MSSAEVELKEISQKLSGNQELINTQELNNGVYTLKIYTDLGLKITKLIIQ